MRQKQILYYECDNRECNLRFPDLKGEIKRERCPMCRGHVRVVLTIDAPIEEDQVPIQSGATSTLEVLLDNLRSGYNVGAIFRSADGIGISKVLLGGITPDPGSPSVQKTSLGAEKNINWEHVNNGVVKIRDCKMAGFSVWGLETSPQALSIYSIGNTLTNRPILLVIGNEVCGIDPDILQLCNHVITIPMVGIKRSFNVATAFGIAASYLRHRQKLSQESNNKLPNT